MKKSMSGKKGNSPAAKAKKKSTAKSSGPSNMAVTGKNQERKWQAQDDARTLAQAQEISMDKKRMGIAVKEANMMAKEAEIQAMKMKSIGKGQMMEAGKEQKK